MTNKAKALAAALDQIARSKPRTTQPPDMAVELVLHLMEENQRLHRALSEYLHAVHPASQRVCAENARRTLAETAKWSRADAVDGV